MAMSKGAEKIAKLLRSKYRVRAEYEFEGLHGKLGVPLRYDFAIVDDAAAITALIEYDGELHFAQNKFFHKTSSDFKKACERDRIKNKYALMHNIPLYRIPYFEIDSINTVEDIFNPKFKVLTKYHNDLIILP